jgi:prepilin-type N-terminal cleavage/methylation domain-containing protein
MKNFKKVFILSLSKGSASTCRRRNGFTLIEILVVIAIVGILASIIIVSLSESRIKSSVGATKKALSHLPGEVSSCCSSLGSLLRGGVGGGDACNPSDGALLPTSTSLQGSSVLFTAPVGGQCTANDPYFRLRITNHPKAECSWNGVTGEWFIYGTKIVSPTGC